MTINLSTKIFNSNFKKEDRKKIHMTKLAKLLDVSVAGVSLNINGRRRWSADLLIKAMLAMGIAYVDKEGKYIMLQTSLTKKEIKELSRFSEELCLHNEDGE